MSFLPGMSGVAGAVSSIVQVDTGFVIAGAGSQTSNPLLADWQNVSNITADDDTAAAPFNLRDSTSEFLIASSFGFSLPGGATPVGIEVRLQLRQSGSASIVISEVNVGKDGSTLGTAKNPNTSIAGSFTNYDFGGPTDLWGLSWSASDINNSTFQVRFEADGTLENDGTVHCDAVWARIYYTV